MGSIVWVGFIAFFVASLAVGIHLLTLWWRTRALPELLIGLGVLGIGPVGFGLSTVGTRMLERNGDDMTAQAIMIASTVALYGGTIAKGVFNWRVYHPSSTPVRTVIYAGIGLLALGFIARLLVFGGRPPSPSHPLALSQSLVQIAVLLWGSYEAIRYFSMMRKRIALGMADPVVCNRFLLWGIGAFAAGFGSLLATGVRLVIAPEAAAPLEPWVLASSSAHGSVAAVAMWLAFVPPSAYVRWIEGRGSARDVG